MFTMSGGEMPPVKRDALPLPALLSAAFVAFTVEADNLAEQQLPHTTTSFGGSDERGAVWLTSLAMWFNCLRGLSDGGPQTVAELEQRVRMKTNLDGMRRWGFITIDGTGRVPRRPGGAGKPHAKPGSVLALTDRGRAADAVWRPLPAVIEARWRERFGAAVVDRLRAALVSVAERLDAALPDFMPISLGHGKHPEPPARALGERAHDRELPLVSLLSRVLLRFELDCDYGARVRLALWSDLIRVLDPSDPVAVRELPALTGVSKEALSVMTGRLQKAGVIVVEPPPASARGEQLRLTPGRGVRARAEVPRRIERTVHAWEQTYGCTTIAELHAALRAVAGDGTRGGSPLFAGLEPPSNGWRAQVPPPRLLPWHPLVLHRGGYPDGS
jgi:DNA-binding MarR family transcriptional regulator